MDTYNNVNKDYLLLSIHSLNNKLNKYLSNLDTQLDIFYKTLSIANIEQQENEQEIKELKETLDRIKQKYQL